MAASDSHGIERLDGTPAIHIRKNPDDPAHSSKPYVVRVDRRLFLLDAVVINGHDFEIQSGSVRIECDGYRIRDATLEIVVESEGAA